MQKCDRMTSTDELLTSVVRQRFGRLLLRSDCVRIETLHSLAFPLHFGAFRN